ncbi:MAG: hypothetical protein JWO09_2836 [Bacteroidetes bacterium]|nr:hypothetical protein [Bacteroidota bacterium]
MRDVFYTVLVVWIIWRIISSVNTIRAKQATAAKTAPYRKKEGETTVEYVPPKNKSRFDGEGEYVDYEEIK